MFLLLTTTDTPELNVCSMCPCVRLRCLSELHKKKLSVRYWNVFVFLRENTVYNLLMKLSKISDFLMVSERVFFFFPIRCLHVSLEVWRSVLGVEEQLGL